MSSLLLFLYKFPASFRITRLQTEHQFAHIWKCCLQTGHQHTHIWQCFSRQDREGEVNRKVNRSFFPILLRYLCFEVRYGRESQEKYDTVDDRRSIRKNQR